MGDGDPDKGFSAGIQSTRASPLDDLHLPSQMVVSHDANVRYGTFTSHSFSTTHLISFNIVSASLNTFFILTFNVTLINTPSTINAHIVLIKKNQIISISPHLLKANGPPPESGSA